MKRFLSVLLCAAFAMLLLPALPQTASAASVTNFNIRLNEPVASYTPDFSPEFNTNVTVYSSVTWQENSPSFSAKLNSSDEFRAGLAYKVEIWIRLSDGNYFPVDGYGDLATAITVNGKPLSSLKIEERNDQNQITEVTVTYEYDPLPGREISSVLVKGVPTPMAGEMPIYSFTLGNNSYDFYPTEPVVWFDKTNNFKQLDSSDTFIQGHVYQLCIWLSANREGGFTFKTDQYGNPKVSATINSWAADKVNKAYEQDGRETIELLYNFPACQAAHTCAPQLVAQQDPTCLLPGFKAYYECACGKCYEDAAGKKLITDMDGYGLIPANGHKWSPTYLYMDKNGHAWICADCKATSDITPHTPGPEATETTPQTCKDCGYIIAPVKGHTHQLTHMPYVPATCLATGTVEHYACSGCTARFSDKEGTKPLPEGTNVIIPTLTHQTGDTWGMDTEFHWHSCKLCGTVLDETKTVHEDRDGKCATCGYVMGAPITEPSPDTDEPIPTDSASLKDKPKTDTTSKSSRENDGNSWLILVLVGLACFGAAVTATVIILKKKKR